MVAALDDSEIVTGDAAIEPVAEAEERMRIGEDLGERYTVDAYLARGGFASVWRAIDRVEGKAVAVKKLDPKPSRKSDFYREMRAMFRLNHPHVVRLINVLEADGRRYLILELCEGASLRTAISKARRQRATWPVSRVNQLIGQMAAGLNSAHAQGLTHRDIKPENALFARSDAGLFGGRSAIKLADFGLASGLTPPDDGRLRNVTGSPAYMAPEQFCGRFGPASDVYALGIVAFELLMGDVPFHGMPNELGYKHLNERPALPSELPMSWVDLLSRMLAKSIDDRPAAEEIAARLSVPDLAPSIEVEPEVAPTPVPRSRRNVRPTTIDSVTKVTIDGDVVEPCGTGFAVRKGRRRTEFEKDGTVIRTFETNVDPPDGKTARFADRSSVTPRMLARPELVWRRSDGTERTTSLLPGVPWQLVAGIDRVLVRVLTGKGFRLYTAGPDRPPQKLDRSGNATLIATDGNRWCAIWPEGGLACWDADGRGSFARIPDWTGTPRSLAVNGETWAVLVNDHGETILRLLRWGPTGGTP